MATLQIYATKVKEDGKFISIPISRSNPPFGHETFEAKTMTDVMYNLLRKREEINGTAVMFTINVVKGRAPTGFRQWYATNKLTIMRANEDPHDATKLAA